MSAIVVLSKLRKREHENGRKLGRGRAAPNASALSALPLFPSPALIFSCVFHLRVIPTI